MSKTVAFAAVLSLWGFAASGESSGAESADAVGVVAPASFAAAQPVWPSGREGELNDSIGFRAEVRLARVPGDVVLRLATSGLYRDVLGVRRHPGERSVSVHICDLPLDWCQGVIPTPDGPIRMRWWKQDGQILYRLDVPFGLRVRESGAAASRRP